MANIEIGPLFEEIGQLVARDVRDDPEGAFLYAECGDGWIAPSVFANAGDHLIYRSASDALCDKLTEAWEAEEPDKRWATLRYEISNGRFTVALQYPDDLDPEESTSDRRQRVLKEQFGDLEVDYSDP